MKTTLFVFLCLAPLSIIAHENDEVSLAENNVLAAIQLCRLSCLILA
jgi:hypothetical protein